MGITGLIPFLEKASRRVHLKELRGSTIAVDTYCWLHKGAFACAEKLVRGEETDAYVTYCMRYVQMMLSYDIKPILVFDGRHLPAKALTETRRRETRKTARKQAAELMRAGRFEEGRSQLRRSVDVTHAMALRVIRECHDRNVDCIVAPYEADAQMAWLDKVGVAQYIVTEDSDLTLFGAQNVIFKLDLTGAGLLVEAQKLHLAMGCRPEKYTFDKFRRMCILSGCDYLDSLPGIGLAKACKFIMMTEEDNMWRALKKIPQYLNMKQLEVTEEYIENFVKAEATFNHMFIYNPIQRKMMRLHELDDYQTEERFCVNAGILLDDNEQAFQLALGNLDPFTLKQLDNWHPDRAAFGQSSTSNKSLKRAKHKSIWHITNGLHEQSVEKNSYNSVSDKNTATNSCALYFKKVDFISKTIDEDISANIREEIAKPREAEIFSMYQREAAIKKHCESVVDEPLAKRRRSSSTNSEMFADSAGDEEAKRATPITPTKSHNPFARVYGSMEERLRKSPVCDSSSLLSALSPKKMKEMATAKLKSRLTSVKRSIYDDSTVEVKSRFFESNIQEVTSVKMKEDEPVQCVVTSDGEVDLTDEIEQIETKAQLHLQNSALLYHSPSPTKTLNNERNITETTTSPHTDNKIKLEDAIILSDEEVDDKMEATKIIKPLEIPTFKRQALRHLGLGKKQNAAKKLTMSDKTQTRLSMFGFQKRPTLR